MMCHDVAVSPENAVPPLSSQLLMVFVLFPRLTSLQMVPERAGVKVRGVQKISLISCARLLVATAPPGTRRALLMAADQAPRRARSMRARGSEISTA